MFKLEPEIAQDIEQLKQIAKRHVGTLVISGLTIVGCIGAWAGGFAIIGSWFGLGDPPESVCLKSKSNLFGGSGWIAAGNFSCSRKRGQVYCDTIFAHEESSVYLKSENGSYYFSLSDLQVGNNIFLKHNTKVFVNNFKFKGISDIDTPPYFDGDILSDDDITNMILNKDDELLIQQIAFRKLTERKAQIWLKVSQIK
jgi:hypothetical protein